MKVKFPKWFNYKVISFSADSVEEINRELMHRGLDASDVISIICEHGRDYWYEVFCRREC